MARCVLLRSVRSTPMGNNQNISFLPAIMSTSCRMHGEFLRLIFLQAHRETEAHRGALQLECHRKTTKRTRSVSSAWHRRSSLQSSGVEDQPQYPGLCHSGSPSARSFSRSPSPPPPSFTQYPSPRVH
jgi:hypothetical protein